ncbi:ABC transporter ATP-binding protein [Erysipelothrix larvae]|uniref:ABC transporter ATP-binding protein n=1 Tax=Erysipelothrix larvae TaxID=1514105 RepID=A0A0X8GZ49_9FIRM|nr:ABC transporter ATP-binding protein [Erysipelothrix larvae]AMC93081.1 ABC transporter ATP-binding protein [Erysipelothrix larvae]
MALVQIKSLNKKYGDFTALHDVSFNVEKGEVLGFIGPNGAGKSTTIRILLGILKANEGSARIFDKDVWDDSLEIHKHVAYVPGDVNLWPNLTGGEVIDLLMSLQGSSDFSKRDDLILRFELDPTKKTRTYSKGNRQKVAIVAALASNADLYIFDEPTSGLDPLMAQVFENEVLSLKQQGKSVILSSHILSEVEKLCDRVAIIREGRIVDIGSLSELRHLARVQMNIKTSVPFKTLFDLSYLSDVKGTPTDFSFSIDPHQISVLIEELAPYGITYIDNQLPSLEDLFMKHYDQSEGTK